MTYVPKLLRFLREYDIILSRGRDITVPTRNNPWEEKEYMQLKKSLSVSLAALLVAGNMAAGIQAVSYGDVGTENVFSEQIGLLSDIGVIKGTGENEFSPDDNVTREQMALLLFRLMIGKDTAGSLNTTSFTDLYDDTYSGAISWANASGYIIGTSENTFEPTGGITMQDAMTMIVRALGHSNDTMNKGYPWTFIDAATKLGLDNGLENISYTKELTRAEVAGILYNALTAEYIIPKTSSNGVTYFESTTIIERVFGYEMDESVLSATNTSAIGGLETVTKDGYVSISGEDGVLTVKFSELGLKGTPDENLGKKLRVVYKRDEKTKLVNVLGCTEIGKTTTPEEITVAKNNTYVTIDGTKYRVVEKLSDALATNANEILVYAYGANGKLEAVKTCEDLGKLLGAYGATLIFDDRNSETADRLIIKPYSFGKLKISGGKVNLAGNVKESDLTIVNPDNAVSGDNVLYYFNEENKTLEIKTVLGISESGVVTRLSDTSATIGGVRYTLGNDKLGISAASIRNLLTVGERARVVAYNGAILAVESSSTSVFAPSKYLIAESTSSPVFANGKFGYVIEANIGGSSTSIFVTNQSVESGKVYRYTIDGDGTYTLIPWTVSGGVVNSGRDQFVQSDSSNDEIAYIISSSNGASINRGGSFYTLSKGNSSAVSSTGMNESAISFVTDSDSVIIVKKNGKYQIANGRYASTIGIEDGASVTAVFRNDPGSVETLRYLYISDGSLGSVDSSASSVKILANTGRELVDGKIYTVYTVLDLTTGKTDSMRSLENDLTVGANYLTTVDGLVSSEKADVRSGIVTGYTGTTISVGGETFALGSDVTVIGIDGENITSLKVSDTYMKHVEVIVKNGAVVSVIRTADPTFRSEYSAGRFTITANDDFTGIGSVKFIGIASVDTETGKETILPETDFTFSYKTEGGLVVTVDCLKEMTAGTYHIVFSVDGAEMQTVVVVK